MHAHLARLAVVDALSGLFTGDQCKVFAGDPGEKLAGTALKGSAWISGTTSLWTLAALGRGVWNQREHVTVTVTFFAYRATGDSLGASKAVTEAAGNLQAAFTRLILESPDLGLDVCEEVRLPEQEDDEAPWVVRADGDGWVCEITQSVVLQCRSTS